MCTVEVCGLRFVCRRTRRQRLRRCLDIAAGLEWSSSALSKAKFDRGSGGHGEHASRKVRRAALGIHYSYQHSGRLG